MLLEQKASVQINSSLIEAAFRGHSEIVPMLLEEKANINYQDDEHHYDALTWSAGQGHASIVKMLLKHKANVNQDVALVFAASSGHMDTVKTLLEHKADVNLQENKFGETALLSAASEGRADIVKMLLEHKSDVNLENKKGNSALSLAKKENHLDVIKMLEPEFESLFKRQKTAFVYGLYLNDSKKEYKEKTESPLKNLSQHPIYDKRAIQLMFSFLDPLTPVSPLKKAEQQSSQNNKPSSP